MMLEEGGAPIKPKRGRSHFFVQEAVFALEPDPAGVNAFIQQVYAILSLQLSTVVLICCLCMYVTGLRSFLAAHAGDLSSTFGLTAIFVLFALVLLPKAKNSYPTNAVLLSVFTLLESFCLGTVCAMYQEAGVGEYVLVAFAMCCCLFWALTLFAFQSNINFSFMGSFLFTALWILLLWGLFIGLFGWRAQLLYSLFGAYLFCGFILYDTWRIINVFGYEEPFVAALELFLDFINLFLYLLQLITGFGLRRQK